MNSDVVIPLNVYQTWKTKNLQPKMLECVESLRKDNPEFTFHLFDDDDCREFIRNNYDNDVHNLTIYIPFLFVEVYNNNGSEYFYQGRINLT
jgi:mannosyltransferase OCH1-like enzyme